MAPEDSGDIPNRQDEKARLECEKLKAEAEKVSFESEKIKAETKAISRRFFTKSEFYVSLTPAILAIATLIYTWRTGWFDVQRTRMENQNTLYQIQSSNLQATAKEQQAHVAAVESDLTNLRAEKERLTTSISQLQSERDALRSVTNFLTSEVNRLEGTEKTNTSKLLAALLAEKGQTQTLSNKLVTLSKDQERVANDLADLAWNTYLLESVSFQANAFDRAYPKGTKIPTDMARSFLTNVLRSVKFAKSVTNEVDYIVSKPRKKVEQNSTNGVPKKYEEYHIPDVVPKNEQ